MTPAPPDERLCERILSGIDRQEVVDLECGLVAIPSFTTEETELARFIVARIHAFGLEACLQEVPLSGGSVGHNVISCLRGSGGGPTLLFFGHMDHEPTLGRGYENFLGWKRNPFTPSVEGDWIYGKGSQDEKGGLCAKVDGEIVTNVRILRYSPQASAWLTPISRI